MSVYFTTSVPIAAPVEAVFDASLNIGHHLDSMSHSGEHVVGGVSSGLIGLGESVTWRARHFWIWWRMTSAITAWDRPVQFVDEQVRGPFASFRHVHHFTALPGGRTLMRDEITFTAPLGPVGLVAERVLLARYLRSLIERRNAWLVHSLSGAAPAGGEDGDHQGQGHHPRRDSREHSHSVGQDDTAQPAADRHPEL